MEELVYQTRVYEPQAPFARADGWSNWNVAPKAYYDYYLAKRDPYIQVRCLKVFSVEGVPV